ncbi:MAG: M20/M25/M40 family metallo-hydrolase [Nitrolancea sp.]
MSAVSPTVLERIREQAEVLRPDLVTMLQQGVRIPSVNPARSGGTGEGEGTFQAFMTERLEELGAAVDVWEPDGPGLKERYGMVLSGSTCDFRGRPNVVGVLRPAGANRHIVHLILNSHADTVAADASRWTRDPYGAEIQDGKLFGLGSADAKGSLLAYLGALQVLTTAGIRLKRPVALTSVVDEEAGGGGTLACIERGYRAPHALVGEPTSLAVCPGSRGAFGVVLRTVGRGAHLGVAFDGVNAIDLALRYVEAFYQLGRQLDSEYLHPLWSALPTGHVFSVTQITSTPSPGSVPSQCELRLSAGYMAGESQDEIFDRVQSAFAAVTASDDWLTEHPPEIAMTFPFIEAAAAPADNPVVTDLLAAAADLGFAAPPVHALSAGTDGRFLTNIGGTAAINFGPGDMAQGHGPDEYLDLEEFQRAIVWVAVAIARHCGVED